MAYSLLQGEAGAWVALIFAHMHACARADSEAGGPYMEAELSLSSKAFCVLRRVFSQLGLA